MPSWSSGVAPGAGIQVAIVEVLIREVREKNAPPSQVMDFNAPDSRECIDLNISMHLIGFSEYRTCIDILAQAQAQAGASTFKIGLIRSYMVGEPHKQTR